MSDLALLATGLHRFEEGASAEAKGKFAKMLIAALDMMGTGPGDAFLLTTAKNVEAYEEAHEAKVQELDDRIEDMIRADHEHEAAAERYDELVEALKDVPRGIRSIEEVLDAEGIK